jgi:peptidoglycan biosynthesis protein MviN/MurJ (putative lipid II flippase)
MTKGKDPSVHRRHWVGRTFRFTLSSFRPGSNFSLRRFSITKEALLFSMAYIASKMLGVIRQVMFNALFGTGPEATAYNAAFRLSDTIFNLISVAMVSVGAIIDTAFASYLPDKASIPAIANAFMLFGLPSVLLAQVVSQSLLPHITLYATLGRYMRMSLTILRIVGGAVLLCIPAALVLYFLGKPTVHLLFQHGAFNAHSSALTSMALFGYAIGLPGQTATMLLVTCFYALKDARAPLFTGIVTIVARIALLLLLFHLLTGRYTILAIPLATSITGTIETACLSLILFLRLRKKIKMDKGLLRLKERRLQRAKTAVDLAVVCEVSLEGR